MDKNISTLNGVISPDDTAVSAISFDTAVTHESSGEFTLPDYLPEIRRVVSVTSTVLPEGRFINGDVNSQNITIEFAGSVVHNILYTNDSGELYCASLSTDYESNTAAPNFINSVSVDTRIDSGTAACAATCRVIGPRKVAVRAKLKSRVMAVNERYLNEMIDSPLTAADELSLERLLKRYESVRIMRGEIGDLRISETIESPPGMVRPVACSAIVNIREIKPQRDVLSVRGDVVVKCICADEGPAGDGGDGLFGANLPVPIGGAQTVVKKIPFAEEIEIDGLTERCSARSWGRCTSVTVGTDDGGADSLFCDLVFELNAEAMTNEAVTSTADMYSTEYECACTYKDADVYSVLRCANGNVSLSGNITVAGDRHLSVIASSADARIDDVEFEKGKIVLRGNCAVKVVTSKSGDKNGGTEYAVEEVSIPLRYECEPVSSAPSTANPDIVWRADCTVTDITERAEADGGSLFVNAEVALSVSALVKNKVNILDRVSIDHAKRIDSAGRDTGLKIYYPHGKDTLWKIAKENHITCSAIAELNGLDSEVSALNDDPASLDGISMLIIM